MEPVLCAFPECLEKFLSPVFAQRIRAAEDVLEGLVLVVTSRAVVAPRLGVDAMEVGVNWQEIVHQFTPVHMRVPISVHGLCMNRPVDKLESGVVPFIGSLDVSSQRWARMGCSDLLFDGSCNRY